MDAVTQREVGDFLGIVAPSPVVSAIDAFLSLSGDDDAAATPSTALGIPPHMMAPACPTLSESIADNLPIILLTIAVGGLIGWAVVTALGAKAAATAAVAAAL